MTKGKKAALNVLWAVDAFEGPAAISEGAAAKMAEQLVQKGAVVTPVFVLSEAQINLWSEVSTPDLSAYQRMARDNILKGLAKIGRVKFAAPKVLTLDITSRRSGAEALASMAVKDKADLILVQTHGRRGVFRALLGSFAESLVLVSKTPVLAINPKVAKPELPGRIAFFTDFSVGSRRALGRVVKLAKVLDAAVNLVHAVPIPTQPMVQSGVALLGAGWVPVGAYLKTETSAQKKRIEKLSAALRRVGVRSEGFVLSDVPSVTAAAMAFSRKRKPQWVACAALSSQVRVILLGALSRNLLRELKVPVLVVREK